MAEIIIDAYVCSGCATCVELAADVFRIDPLTEKAALLVLDEVPLTEAVYQAAAFCPEKCIEIVS